MQLYRDLLRPAFFRIPPETIHHAAITALQLAGPALRWVVSEPDERLARTVFGLKFPNPVGLAAGLDKNAVAIPAWEGLGFGFAEVGTITARPQPGNPRPRLFRIPENRALINRMGFNNDGAAVAAERLRRLRDSGGWPQIPLGVNLGKSKVTPLEEAVDDYLFSFERLRAFGDYFVLNVSSPNTPNLRSLQNKGALEALVAAVQSRNTERVPLLVKIAPDLTFDAIEDVIALAEKHALAGLIATNTTIDHSSIAESRRTTGGLSGAPVRQRSTEIVRFMTSRTKLPIVAVGGIMSADDALEKFDAGAALVQIYTGFIYEGPKLVADICDALLRRA